MVMMNIGKIFSNIMVFIYLVIELHQGIKGRRCKSNPCKKSLSEEVPSSALYACYPIKMHLGSLGPHE